MNYKIGEIFKFRKTFSESDVYLYGGIICDSSPWHIDEIYAKESRFGGRLVYGMLTASLFSTVIGRNFPEHVYLGQDVSFHKPVYIGDTVEAIMEIEEISESGKILFKCSAINQNGSMVLSGKGSIIRI